MSDQDQDKEFRLRWFQRITVAEINAERLVADLMDGYPTNYKRKTEMEAALRKALSCYREFQKHLAEGTV